MPASARTVRTSVTLDAELLREARALNLNVSAVVEGALREELRAIAGRERRKENAEALRLREAWLDRHGPPLKEHLPAWAQALSEIERLG